MKAKDDAGSVAGKFMGLTKPTWKHVIVGLAFFSLLAFGIWKAVGKAPSTEQRNEGSRDAIQVTAGRDAVVVPGGQQAGGNIINTTNVTVSAASKVPETTLDARNDSRAAFDQLRAWAKDHNFAEQQKAVRAVESIIAENDQWVFTNDPMLQPAVQSELDKKPFSEVRSLLFAQDVDASTREALILYIGHRDDAPKHEKLQCLVDLINAEKSVRLTRQEIRRFIIISHAKNLRMLDIDAVQVWWQTNKDGIKQESSASTPKPTR